MTVEPQTPPRRALSPNQPKNVIALLGPTNTGKTHYAVERMLAHESGMIGLPLRLLAREVYDRIVQERSPKSVALITGEEKDHPREPELLGLHRRGDAPRPPGRLPRGRRDPTRPGPRNAATPSPAASSTPAAPRKRSCSAPEPCAARCASSCPTFSSSPARACRSSRTPGEKKVSRLPRRSAIVAFSADQVYGLAEQLRRQRGGAAVVMGALSPRTRNAQVALYQSGDVDFIVATDAIGMGLNMDIDHVAFAARRKFDGHQMRDLKAHEIGQIAGRAGRYLNDGDVRHDGGGTALRRRARRPHRESSLRSRARPAVAERRARFLVDPQAHRIARGAVDGTRAGARQADDRFDRATRNGGERRHRGPRDQREPRQASVAGLPIPDFQQTIIDEHVRLLTNIYTHLTENDGRLPEDWIAGHVTRLDNTEGDIDTLSTRLAYIRTWTFVSNRGGWLAGRRAVAREDARGRGSPLRRAAREADTSLHRPAHERPPEAPQPRRSVERHRRRRRRGHGRRRYVGRLSGFQFVLDPRATASRGALEAKALRGVAMRKRSSRSSTARRRVFAPHSARKSHSRIRASSYSRATRSRASRPDTRLSSRARN